MTSDLFALLAILVVMIYLFLTEKLPLDLTAFLGLTVITVAGYITADQAFSGFSSPAVITMLATFVLAAALKQTGLAGRLAYFAKGLFGSNEVALVAVTVLVSALLSAFINNVAAVAILLPAVINMASASGVSPSRLLIPLSFGALLGGTLTLIGTTPNLLAATILSERGYEPFGFFDFAVYGLFFVLVGLVFLVFFGRQMLPRRDPLGRGRRLSELATFYRIQERLFTLRVPQSFSLNDRTLADCNIGGLLGLEVLAIERDGQKRLSPTADEKVIDDDLLVVEGRVDELETILRLKGLEIAPFAPAQWPVNQANLSGVTVRIPENSAAAENSLSEIDFDRRARFLVIGIEREGAPLSRDLGKQRLQEQDLLYAIGSQEELFELLDHADFEVVEERVPIAKQFERSNLFAVKIPLDSPLDNISLEDSRIGELTGLTIVALKYNDSVVWVPTSQAKLKSDAMLLMAGDPELARKVIKLAELKIESREVELDLETEKSGVLEVVLSPRSSLIGKTVRGIGFRERFGFQVLALWREGRPRRARFADEQLCFGNALLLQGPRAKFQYLAQDPDFVVLTGGQEAATRPEKSIYVVIALLGMVLLSAFNLQPPQMAAFMAAVFVALTGAVTLQEAYDQIEWRILFLVAALLPIGVAIESTGGAFLLAQAVLGLVGDAGPYLVLLAFALLSTVISQLLDGALAVVLLSTIALQTSEQIGISPYPFVMAIALSASIAFLAPFSHKANLLVMSAGGYSARDFFRVGSILTILLLIVVVVIVPIVLPF